MYSQAMTKRILFITATRIGDAILSTSVLNHFRSVYPDCKITVACGALTQSLFKGDPNVDEILPMVKGPWAAHWRKLATQTYGRRWDIIIDLRNSAVSRLLRGTKKYIFKGGSGHKCEQFARMLGAASIPLPCLFFDPTTTAQANAIMADKDTVGRPIIALAPAANWPGKMWPKERFLTLVEKMTADDGLLPRARIAVFAAPGEEDVAYYIYDRLPAERRIDMIAKGSPALSAACIAHAALFVGNDSGLMHAAAACDVPTTGIFGPTDVREYGPAGLYTSTACAQPNETFVKTIDTDEGIALMHSIDVDAVYAAAAAVLAQKPR